jgi:hypothetical protein
MQVDLKGRRGSPFSPAQKLEVRGRERMLRLGFVDPLQEWAEKEIRNVCHAVCSLGSALLYADRHRPKWQV